MATTKKQGSSPRAGTAAASKAALAESKLPTEYTPLADRITALKVARSKENPDSVIFSRETDHERGVVRTTLTFPNGDRIGGEGADTEAAVAQLEQRLEAFPK